MSTSSSSPITSRPAQIEFTNRFVQPPSGFYIFRDDLLFIRSQSLLNDLILRLRGRLLTPKGEILTLDFPHNTGNFVREPVIRTFPLAEGFLLGLAITPPVLTVRRGEVYATVGITRGGEVERTITQILFAGYIEGAKSPSWPSSGIESSTDGQGALFRRFEVDQAAGAEVNIIVPANVRWRVISLSFPLVTAAGGSNRLVHIEILKAGSRVGLIPATGVQGASTTFDYTAGTIPVYRSIIGTAKVIGLPDGLILQATDEINTVTTNLAAGDNFGQPIIYVEEWMQED